MTAYVIASLMFVAVFLLIVMGYCLFTVSQAEDEAQQRALTGGSDRSQAA